MTKNTESGESNDIELSKEIKNNKKHVKKRNTKSSSNQSFSGNTDEENNSHSKTSSLNKNKNNNCNLDKKNKQKIKSQKCGNFEICDEHDNQNINQNSDSQKDLDTKKEHETYSLNENNSRIMLKNVNEIEERINVDTCLNLRNETFNRKNNGTYKKVKFKDFSDSNANITSHKNEINVNNGSDAGIHNENKNSKSFNNDKQNETNLTDGYELNNCVKDNFNIKKEKNVNKTTGQNTNFHNKSENDNFFDSNKQKDIFIHQEERLNDDILLRSCTEFKNKETNGNFTQYLQQTRYNKKKYEHQESQSEEKSLKIAKSRFQDELKRNKNKIGTNKIIDIQCDTFSNFSGVKDKNFGKTTTLRNKNYKTNENLMFKVDSENKNNIKTSTVINKNDKTNEALSFKDESKNINYDEIAIPRKQDADKNDDFIKVEYKNETNQENYLKKDATKISEIQQKICDEEILDKKTIIDEEKEDKNFRTSDNTELNKFKNNKAIVNENVNLNNDDLGFLSINSEDKFSGNRSDIKIYDAQSYKINENEILQCKKGCTDPQKEKEIIFNDKLDFYKNNDTSNIVNYSTSRNENKNIDHKISKNVTNNTFKDNTDDYLMLGTTEKNINYKNCTFKDDTNDDLMLNTTKKNFNCKNSTVFNPTYHNDNDANDLKSYSNDILINYFLIPECKRKILTSNLESKNILENTIDNNNKNINFSNNEIVEKAIDKTDSLENLFQNSDNKNYGLKKIEGIQNDIEGENKINDDNKLFDKLGTEFSHINNKKNIRHEKDNKYTSNINIEMNVSIHNGKVNEIVPEKRKILDENGNNIFFVENNENIIEEVLNKDQPNKKIKKQGRKKQDINIGSESLEKNTTKKLKKSLNKKVNLSNTFINENGSKNFVDVEKKSLNEVIDTDKTELKSIIIRKDNNSGFRDEGVIYSVKDTMLPSELKDCGYLNTYETITKLISIKDAIRNKMKSYDKIHRNADFSKLKEFMIKKNGIMVKTDYAGFEKYLEKSTKGLENEAAKIEEHIAYLLDLTKTSSHRTSK